MYADWGPPHLSLVVCYIFHLLIPLLCKTWFNKDCNRNCMNPVLNVMKTLGTSNQAIYYNLLHIYFSSVLLSDDNSLIPGCLWLLVFFFIFFFDTRYLVFYNLSPPRMGLSLDLLSEYRIQHGAIGSLYVTSSYSTWIFCRGVSGFATDCPCGISCRGLTTCLLHVGPPFENRLLNDFFFVFWHMQLYMSWCIIYFFGFIFTS